MEIAVVMLIAGVGAVVLIALVAWFGLFRPSIGHCPCCNCQGPIAGFGRQRCIICDTIFVTDMRGKIVSSLLKSLSGCLIFTISVIALVIILNVTVANEKHWFKDVGFVFILLLTEPLQAVFQKKFPADNKSNLRLWRRK